MKFVNIILGVATTLILSALITLGIQAFYPAPQYPVYPAQAQGQGDLTPPCTSNDIPCGSQSQASSAAATQEYNQEMATYNTQETAYNAAVQVYGRNVFIIANIIGILMFALGFWIIFGTAIATNGAPIGIMLAGLWSIIYGYAQGWGSTDDRLKFFIGLVIAVLVIGGGVWLMERHTKKRV